MMDKVWVIVGKEWAEVFKNRFVLITVAFMPLVFTGLPLIILYAMQTSGEMPGDIPFDGPAQFGQLCEGLSGGECMQFYILTQFMLLFMLLPVVIPVTIASYSIVGEKTTRTLEPVLATPITTMELLAGKALAAVIPAVIASTAGYLVFAIGALIITGGLGLTAKLFSALWLIAVFIVGPLLAIAAVSVAVMVSSRANDPRVAEQLSVLVILPIIGLFFGQLTGFVILNEQLILWMALGLVVIDAGLLYFATQLFQRETILTRWR